MTVDTEVRQPPPRAGVLSRLSSSGRLRGRSDLTARLLLIVVGTLVAGAVVAGATEGFSLFIWQLIAANMIFAASVNFLFGTAGVFSFGQAAVWGAGGYATALVGMHYDIRGPLALLFAGVAAAAISVVVGLALYRISGVPFAIVTLAASEILLQLTFRIDALQGEDGIPGVFAGTFLGFDLLDPDTFWWYIVAVVAVCLVGLFWVQESRLGQVLRTVRDDPELARSLGIAIVPARIIAFVIAGFFGGVAGGLFAQVQFTVTPDMFHFSVSGLVVVVCLIGGLGTFTGPLVGAAAYVWAQQHLSSGPNLILYTGLALLVVVLLAPDGLVGTLSRAARGAAGLVRRRT